MSKDFFELGRKTKNIEVTISYRIIQLFSEGLYSSPNKAIEELVTNSFDAGAENVHVILPSDFHSDKASIVIIDDGEGMDYNDLANHWIIGKSLKAKKRTRGSRSQIGKFGIGKLATYVLSNRLTHISKKAGKYYSTSMDYNNIPQADDEGVFAKKNNKEKVSLPFRELSESEAKQALEKWILGEKKGYKALKLFGRGSKKSWTVSIMSELKSDMMSNLKTGKLKWVLSTALPLRDDFKLYLDGNEVSSSRRGKAQKVWTLGKDLKVENLEKPAPEELVDSEDETATDVYGIHEPSLGRITGYVELYDDPLDTGKSADNGRNNGFFIYVKDRLIKEDDGHFGIGSNELSHGTFARFRAIINIDKLDDDLRSSRENVRESISVVKTRNLLKAIFNFIRREWNKREDENSPGAKFSSALAASPYTLTHRPLLNLIKEALSGRITPKLLNYSRDLKENEKKKYIELFEKKIEENESIVKSVDLTPLSPDDPITLLEIDTGILKINSYHPFVGHFVNEYENAKSNLPLELLALSEVLLEASLIQSGIDSNITNSILDQRDELLRTLAKSTTQRNSFLIAQALQDAENNKTELEIELVASFNNMGFDAVRISGKNNPDGVATASLSVSSTGATQSYKVHLEAKSKEEKGKKVQNNSVRISTIARHRDAYGCDHAIVIGPDFPAKDTALETEIKQDATNTGKTITVMTIADLARLVRLRPLKRIGLLEIRELFKCRMPEDCKAWVDSLEKKKVEKPDYKRILQVIWNRQGKRPSESVKYAAIAVVLENEGINLSEAEIISICKSLEGMAKGFINCLDNGSVEIRTKPDIVLDIIKAESSKFPENELKFSFLK